MNFPVDIIFGDERRPPAEFQPAFLQDADPAAQVEDQQIVAPRVKGHQVAAVQPGRDVVEQHRVLANGVNPHLVQGLVLEVNAVAAAEDVGMLGALQKAVDSQTAVRPRDDARITKNGRWCDAQGQEDEIRRQGVAVVQGDGTEGHGLRVNALADGNSPSTQGLHDSATDRFGKAGHESPARTDGDTRHVTAGGGGQLPDIAGHLRCGGAATDNDHIRDVPGEMVDEAAFCFHEPFDGLDGKDIVKIAVNGRLGDIAARVAGEDVIGNRVPVFKNNGFLFRIDPGRFARQEGSTLLFNHMPGGKANLIRPVGAGKHARPHARVVMMIRRADDGHGVTFFGNLTQVGQRNHVSMAPADKYQSLFHIRPLAPGFHPSVDPAVADGFFPRWRSESGPFYPPRFFAFSDARR
jgi:hypothetical protein